MFKIYIESKDNWFAYTIKFIFSNIPYLIEMETDKAKSDLIIDKTLPFVRGGHLEKIRRIIDGEDDYIRYIFDRISCFREYQMEKEGVCINSLYGQRKELGFNYSGAPVNKLLMVISDAFEKYLEKSVLQAGLKQLHPNNKKFSICLTHDIDTIRPL